MSKAYKCDICNSFYDNNDIPITTYTKKCMVQLVEYDTHYDIDICPKCTAKLQKTVDDIRRAEIKQSGAIDGVVDGVEVNYTKC